MRVQVETIPSLLAGRDVVLHAPTGSGKTLVYFLPLVERLERPGPGPRALVLTPVRELAAQVDSVYRRLGPNGRIAPLHGGVGYFDFLRGGETVTFTVEPSPKGPRANQVRVSR